MPSPDASPLHVGVWRFRLLDGGTLDDGSWVPSGTVGVAVDNQLGFLSPHFENLPRRFIQIHVVEFQRLVFVDTNAEGSLDVTDRFRPLHDVRRVIGGPHVSRGTYTVFLAGRQLTGWLRRFRPVMQMWHSPNKLCSKPLGL